MEDTEKRAEVLANSDFEESVADMKANLFTPIDKSSTLYKEMQGDIEAYHASSRDQLAQRFTPEQADDLATIQTSMMFNLAQLSGMKFNDFVRLNPVKINFSDTGEVTDVTLYQPMNADVDINTRVNVVDISDFIKNAKDSHSDVVKNILSLLQDGEPLALNSADNKAIVKIIKENAEHMGYSKASFYKKLAPVRNMAIKDITSLIKSAVLIESVPNTKVNRDTKSMSKSQKKAQKHKNGIETFHRLYVPVKIGKGKNASIYTIRIVAEEKKGEIVVDPKQTELYDIVVEGKKKVPPASRHPVYNTVRPYIASNTNFMSVTIAEMLQGVKDYSEENFYILNQSNSQSGKRGSIIPAKKVNAGQVSTITLTQNADVSTVMHEMAHFALNYMKGINATAQIETLGRWWGENATELLKDTDCTEDDLKMFTEELASGVKNESLTDDKRSKLSTATQEYFARGFEAYLREGKSPNAEMRNIFRRMREWIKAIYNQIRLNVTLNDDVRELFDKLLVSDSSIERAEAESGYDISDDTIMTAKEIFFRRVADELLASDAERIKNFRDDRLPLLREEIQAQPIHQAVDKTVSYEGINKDTIPAELKGKIPSEALAKTKDGGIDFEFACAVAQDTAGYQTEDEFINDLVDYVSVDDAVNATLDAEVANLFGDIIENYDETTLRAEGVLHGLDEASDNIATAIVASDEELGAILDGTGEQGQGQTLYQNDADYGTDDDTDYQDEEAVDKLLEEQKGEVKNAMHDDRLSGDGNIDFIWGKEGNKDKEYRGGYGFAHIVAKHGIEAAKNVPNIIKNGELSFDRWGGAIYTYEGSKAVLQQQQNFEQKNWVLTSYAIENKKSLGTNQDVQTGQFSDGSRSPSRQNIDDIVSSNGNDVNREILNQDDISSYGEELTPEEQALLDREEEEFASDQGDVQDTLNKQDTGVLDEEGNDKFDFLEEQEKLLALQDHLFINLAIMQPSHQQKKQLLYLQKNSSSFSPIQHTNDDILYRLHFTAEIIIITAERILKY